eukprot:gene9466-7537_t
MDALGVLSDLARASARLTREPHSLRHQQHMQSLAIVLQRANALAILRRAPSSAPTCAPLRAARSALQSAEIERVSAAGGMVLDTDVPSLPAAPVSGAVAAAAAPASPATSRLSPSVLQRAETR